MIHSFHVICWNINGFKNNILVHNAIRTFKPHIFVLIEAHLGANDTIEFLITKLYYITEYIYTTKLSATLAEYIS